MNKNNVFLIAFVVIVVGGIGVYVAKQRYLGPPQIGKLELQDTVFNTQESAMHEVVYTDAGFSPSPLTVKAGDTVTFVNNSSQAFWPASAMHPMHTSYPGSDIEKCGRPEAQSIFDACSAHMQDSSWSFKFMEKGKWNYHDHLSASKYGTVIVE